MIVRFFFYCFHTVLFMVRNTVCLQRKEQVGNFVGGRTEQNEQIPREKKR